MKRLYLIDLNVTDADGILEKKLLVDLLDIDDPRDIGGDLPGLAPNKFEMPFDSIECVLPLSKRALAVAIDTNFLTEDGRSPGVADSTEIIRSPSIATSKTTRRAASIADGESSRAETERLELSCLRARRSAHADGT